MRTQVAIIGAGPAGLILSHLLRLQGVDSVVLEHRSRERVEGRIRAGVLEPGTVALLDGIGVAARLKRQGLEHGGFRISFDGDLLRVDLEALTGASVTVYGQTEITKDLIDAALVRAMPVIFEAEDVTPHEFHGGPPHVTWTKDGELHRLDCDLIAGCDGFHGVSRRTLGEGIATHELVYPFGWLGILADVPPCSDELVYASHANGFALASMRSESRSRYYLQVPMDERLEDWPDARIWDELAVRLGPDAEEMARGPALEKSIAPLRSFVAEPMRHGRLLLAGDAAHIVPPTGAKGLNLAASDAHFLAQAVERYYGGEGEAALDAYSGKALARVWKAERFSWWFTGLTHRFSNDGFERRLKRAEFDYLASSDAARTALAENYIGLPLG